jgi:hypothetical protein
MVQVQHLSKTHPQSDCTLVGSSCNAANVHCRCLLPLPTCRFKDQGLGFACGGSGSLFKTQDGGKSWKRDKVQLVHLHSVLYMTAF